MKIVDWLTIAVLLLLGTGALASSPQESDYPSDFYVKSAGIDSGSNPYLCWMHLETEAQVFAVKKDGYLLKPCSVYDAGQHLRGRRSGNHVDLLIHKGKGKLKVDRWLVYEMVQ